MKIALDAMGGDFAPASTVAGAIEALRKYADVEVIFVGDRARIEKELALLEVPAAIAKRCSSDGYGAFSPPTLRRSRGNTP